MKTKTTKKQMLGFKGETDFFMSGAYKTPINLLKESPLKDLYYKSPDDITIKDIQLFNKWLRANKKLAIYLYHGTGLNNEADIKLKGLLPTSIKRRNSYQSASGFVYLSPFPYLADRFASMVASTNHTEKVIYEVILPIEALLPDKDNLRNARMFGKYYHIKDTLAESIIYGHSVRVKGAIPNSAIKGKYTGQLYGLKQTKQNTMKTTKKALPLQKKQLKGNFVDTDLFDAKQNVECFGEEMPILVHNTTLKNANAILSFGFSTERFGETSKETGYANLKNDLVGVYFTHYKGKRPKSEWRGSETSTIYTIPFLKNPLMVFAWEMNDEFIYMNEYLVNKLKVSNGKQATAKLRKKYDGVIFHNKHADITEIVVFNLSNLLNFKNVEDAKKEYESIYSKSKKQLNGLKNNTMKTTKKPCGCKHKKADDLGKITTSDVKKHATKIAKVTRNKAAQAYDYVKRKVKSNNIVKTVNNARDITRYNNIDGKIDVLRNRRDVIDLQIDKLKTEKITLKTKLQR